MQVEQTRLGDINTLFIHSPGATASTVQVWFRAGSALEEESNQGIAHFLEHMFFKGTPTRPGAALAQEVESFGGEFNAFTSFDYTCYYINAPAARTHDALEILLDMVANPMFNTEDLPAEREVVFEEYRRALDNPSQYHFMQLQEACFEGGYKHPILGREQTIKTFTTEQLRAFRQKFYNAQNSLLVVAGDLRERMPYENLISRFRLPSGEDSVFGAFMLPTAPKLNVHSKPIRQATLTLAISAPAYHDTNASAEDLAINCLAHGETSRLYQDLVASTSLCNGVAGSSMYFAQGACHMIKANFPMENLSKVLTAFEKTLIESMKDGPRDEEVAKIKGQYVAGKVYEKESLESYAFSLGHGFAQSGDIFCEDGFIARLKDTSARKVAHALPIIFSRPVHATLQVPQDADEDQAMRTLSVFQKKLQKTARTHTTNFKPRKTTQIPHDPAVCMVDIVPGVRLIHRQNKLTPTFVLHHYSKGGIIAETGKDCGKHALLSRMLTYGYKGTAYKVLKEDLETRSASLSGFAGKNAYGLTMHGQSADFDDLLKHFAGTILSPAIPEKFFRHERQLVMRMLDNQKEDPVKQAFKQWYQFAFFGHPYALDASGTPETLKRMSPTLLKRIHMQHLASEDLLFTYCGDLDLETVILKLQEAFKALKPRKASKVKKHSWKGKVDQTKHIEMPREQVQIVIGKPACKLTDKNDVYLKLITAHLSGQGSELFVEVRDRQGLCYAVQPVHVAALDAGCWGIYIGSGHDKKSRALDAIMGILKELSVQGISPDEFERAKNMLEGQQQLSVQTNEDFAQFYSIPALHRLGLDFQHESQRLVRECQYGDFQRFIKEFMAGSWNIVTVGPS